MPESFEERTLKAADQIISEGLAKIILIGNREKILAEASKLGLENISNAEIVDPESNPKTESLPLKGVEGQCRQGARFPPAAALAVVRHSLIRHS